MAEPTHVVHKIPFERKGTCKPTAACRAGCWRECIDECPHGEMQGSKPRCTIHDTRHLVCQECSDAVHGGKKITHQGCIDFPNHPWLAVIREGTCSYEFTRLDEMGNPSLEPLPFIDE